MEGVAVEVDFAEKAVQAEHLPQMLHPNSIPNDWRLARCLLQVVEVLEGVSLEGDFEALSSARCGRSGAGQRT